MIARAALALLATLVAACAFPGGEPPPRTAQSVDLDRYLGRWYEIASYPSWFQSGCVATTATYTPRDDGRIGVVNECRDGALDGKARRIEGIAWVAGGDASNSRLFVRFFWPFRGSYWILAVDSDYRWALVGHPARDYLWILSRTPAMEEDLYRELLRRAEGQGYDVSRLRRTLQPGS